MSIPSWATYSSGYDADPSVPRDPVLTAYVELVGGALRSLGEEVRTIEARQVTLDRRLVEFGGLLQGLQEEQYSQGCTLERGQQTAAYGAQRALNTAVAVQRHLEQEDEWQTCLDRCSDTSMMQLEKRWSAKLDAHQRWLQDLSSEVKAISGEVPRGNVYGLISGGATLGLGQRISALERGQKTVAVGARRALHTAMVVHQQQQSQEHESQWDKCLDSLPVVELERACNQRFTEQDDRLDAILQMVDSLADKVLVAGALKGGDARSGGNGNLAVSVMKLREKVEEVEANLYGMASQGGLTLSDRAGRVLSPRGSNALVAAVESLESRVDRYMGEVGSRLDALQDGREQQRLILRQLSHQLPEVSQKLDQLWTQCQHYFPRVKEHDVHFSFFRTSFENHKQQMLELADGLGGRKPQTGSRSTSPTETRFAAEGAHPSGPGTSTPGPAASSCGDESELRARTSMLAQVMARLRATSGEGGTPVPGGAEPQAENATGRE